MPAILLSFRSTSAILLHMQKYLKNAAASPERKITDIYTYLDLSITQYFCKSDLTRVAGTAAVSTPVCVSVPGIAEVQFSKTELQPQIGELQPQRAGNTLLSTLECAEGQKTKTVQLPQNGKPAPETPETTLPKNKGVVEGYFCQIHATDYKHLDVPEPRTTCHSCGRGIRGMWRD